MAALPHDRLGDEGSQHFSAVIREAGAELSVKRIEDFRLDLDVADGETLAFAFESFSDQEVPNAAVLELRAQSASGARLAIPKWTERSQRIGEIKHLAVGTAEELALTVFSIDLPQDATRLQVVGHRNKSRVSSWIIGEPVLNREGSEGWRFTTDTGLPLEYDARHLRQELRIPVGARRCELSIHHVARGSASSGPIAVAAFDAQGQELLPLDELQQHPRLGSIVLLTGEPDEHHTSLLPLNVPANAATLRIVGQNWGKRTAMITGNVELRAEAAVGRSIEEFVSAVPDEATLIVIDTTAPPMGHETLGLRPNNLSLAYARLGLWVIFLPFSSLKEFPADVNERIYQVGRADTEALWNALRDRRRGRDDIYICSSFPSMEANAATDEAHRLGWQVAYEVRDDMEEFNRVGYSKWYTPVLEHRMLRRADRVVSVSRALDEKMLTMHPGLREHSVIPNGVRISTIEGGESLRTAEVAEQRRSSTTVGYVGHLTPSWFDWPMLLRAASRRTDVRFELVGHGMPEGMDLPSNVVYLGPKTHAELPDVVASWRAGLIPFLDIPLTRSVDPNKIYEYFAWGLRCVTIDMGAVSTYPWTRVYSDLDTFVEAIDWALESPMEASDHDELEEFLHTVDWDSRARQMLEFLKPGVQL